VSAFSNMSSYRVLSASLMTHFLAAGAAVLPVGGG